MLLIFVFALLGMELFAYRTVQDEEGNFIVPQKAFELLKEGKIKSIEHPRENFNDLFSALITVYILIVGEDWPAVMSILYRGLGTSLGRGYWIAMTYCIVGIIFGNMIMLALFAGILLQAFADGDMDTLKDVS